VDRVYDFALPPLVLHAIFNHTARYLKQWLEISPRNSVTVLDTHDGIGVIDIGVDRINPEDRPGLVPSNELDDLVEKIHANSNGQSRLATGAAASNLDLYQVNCTFYDALGRNDNDYLLARAIQFFVPGVPQVYYVGLEEVDRCIKRPVVQSLFGLIHLRNRHPAFDGSFSMPGSQDSRITLRWDNGGHWAMLEVDFGTGSFSISSSPFESVASK
jgi:sucrose phosphorylase